MKYKVKGYLNKIKDYCWYVRAFSRIEFGNGERKKNFFYFKHMCIMQ